MVKSHRNFKRDQTRARLYYLRQRERRQILSESWWDKSAAELVSMHDYYHHRVDPGDVLFDQRGYVHPDLELYSHMEVMA